MRIIFLIAFLLPSLAFAHAVPQGYSPEPGTLLSEVPEVIRITVSERPETGSSGIKIKTPSGLELKESRLENEYSLVASLPVQEEGVYTVEWRALSKDDGHFTTGSFNFAVGTSSVGLSGASTAVVPKGNANEQFFMSVELLGHGLLWAALIFSLLYSLRFKNDATRISVMRVGQWAILCGALFIIAGAAIQLYIKAVELEVVLDGGIREALFLFASSQAGISILIRMSVGVIFAVFGIFWRSIADYLERVRFAPLFAILLVFVAARSYISHALANPFYPELSFLVNMMHLIEKDAWAGILVLMLGALLWRHSRQLMYEMRFSFENLLGWIFAGIILSASYIIWLHLKGFENLFTTQWGALACQLIVAATALAGMRIYHLFAVYRRADIYRRFWYVTLGAEVGLAILVLHFSSVVISTTPPLHAYAPITQATQAGITVSISPNKSNDAQYLVSVSPDAPVAFSTKQGDIEQPIKSAKLLWSNSYPIPRALLPQGTELLAKVTPQNAYDQHFVLTIPELPTHERTLDTFTIIFVVAALFGFLCAVFFLRWIIFQPRKDSHHIPRFGLLGIIVAVSVFGLFATVLHILDEARVFTPFRKVCETDGGLWHVMPATMDNKTFTKESSEGCMITNEYHIVDRDMYTYFSTLPQTSVTWNAPARILSQNKTPITVSVRDSENKPGTLWLRHEKIGHFIAVSRDQKQFLHVHADSDGPISESDVQNATLTFRPQFPADGEYIIGFDYAQGARADSASRKITVGKGVSAEPQIYGNIQEVDGIRVELKYTPIFVNSLATLQFRFDKDGKPLTTLEPYLAAAGHVAIVKNDLSLLRHEHAEYHPLSTPLNPPEVINGKIVHRHVLLQSKFGPNLDVHTLLPEPGVYTLWIEYKTEGTVRHLPFTIRVE